MPDALPGPALPGSAPPGPAAPRTGAPRTALVTGASAGIGREFARRLAARGEDLVIVARRRDRLTALADELAAAHGTTTLVVTADLTAPDGPRQVLQAVEAAGLRVDTLVNSAGFGTAGRFAAEDPDRIGDEIRLNVVTLTLLSRLFMPHLTASPRGVLINVSSNASFQPLPSMAVYAATKAYVTSLSAALWQEARGTNLRVLAFCPGPTATEFFEAAGSDRFKVGRVVPVEQAVDVALRALARPAGGPMAIVGLANRVQAYAARVAPLRLTLAVGAALTRDASPGPGTSPAPESGAA